jgi:hypothetical protein
MANKKDLKNLEIGESKDVSTQDAKNRIFNLKADEELGARVVVMPTPIHDIYPDLRQPRRAVPTAVRGNWNGDPDELGNVLEHWRLMAEGELGKKIDVVKALNGGGALEMEEGAGPIYSSFAKMVSLAFAIKNEGLTNPITIVRNGSMWQVETGERRWLAHHLLYHHIDETKFGKIAAREVKYDPFRQASENNARDGYNAIEMARQIAILIMEARTGIDGMKYDTFEDMVFAGECDRRFYAQVANGNIHRIPEGLGDKIANATGLSLKRISHYRALLAPTEDDALNDQIWVDADANGWTEHFIRETYLPSLKPPKETSTAVEVPSANEGGFTPNNAQSTTPNLPTPYHDWIKKDAFGRVIDPPKASPFGAATPSAKQDDSKVYGAIDMNLKGKFVRLKDGREGTIWEDNGEKVMFLKAGATISNEVYRSAIWSVGTNIPAADTPKTVQKNEQLFKEGDYVIVRTQSTQFTGFVRFVKEDEPRYGVFGDVSKSTHYYHTEQITLAPRASDNPSSTKQEEETAAPLHNPNDKVLNDPVAHTLLSQLSLMAKMLENGEAERSLNYLMSASFGDVSKASRELNKETVHQLLENHLQSVGTLLTQLNDYAYSVLKDIAEFDAAEREGSNG